MTKLNSDKKWQSLNRRLEAFMKTNDFFAIGTIYYEMADFLKSESKNNDELHKLGYKMKLKGQEDYLSGCSKAGVLKGVEILSAHDSCDLCKNQNGKIFTIEKAFSDKPIPVEHCTHRYGCRCTYIPVV